ncbi:hypothetical protein [Actinokineospora bangkokensis]|nr:hypothetical protein [Actinokineospora bangkokensis]
MGKIKDRAAAVAVLGVVGALVLAAAPGAQLAWWRITSAATTALGMLS